MIHSETAETAAKASSATPPETASAASYRALMRRRLLWLVSGIAAFVALDIADLVTGPSMIGMGEVAQTHFAPAGANSMTRVIVFDIRLPVTCMAILVGIGLGMAGVHMQTILGNPLAC
jgi:iron complex transport system permease protein